jgi:hypothetical protein
MVSVLIGSSIRVVRIALGFYAPSGDGLIRERHETDYLICVAQLLKSGPVTTTLPSRSVTVAEQV